MSDAELWRSVPGWDAYEVSNLGNVRRVRINRGTFGNVGRLLKLTVGNHGYCSVGLSQGGRYRRMLVHRLVAMAFLDLRPEQHVDHRNGDRTNNRVSNLRPCTLAQNNKFGAERGVYAGERGGGARLTEANVRTIRDLADSVPWAELAERFGVRLAHVRNIIKRRSWTHI